MSVTNGQAADQTTFNNAFASKQSDNTLDGIQSLEHPTSGGNIANLQQTVNDNTDNIATNTADIATQGTDISNLQNDVTDLQTETTDLRTLTGTSAPAVDLGTFTGSIITDNSQIKPALQELENEIELKIDLTEKGAANGVAPLDGSSKIDASYLPASVVGALNYQGTWNASTNTPTLSSGSGTKGFYYVVSVAGSTTLDGVSSWAIGDWVVYNGTAWEKVDNTDVVTSVNTQTGAVVLDTDDVSEGATNLYYTDVRVAANSAVAANTAKVSADGSINTHSDVDTATNPPALNDALVWDGSNWVPDQVTGSGGGGDKNYITNSGAETDTAGWATYADAAGASPVDGTGGSPTVTFTRSTSSPLSGTASFIFTKDAANRQGEGSGYPFTIDAADKARVLDISFDYLVDSGTFVAGNSTTDSDVTVFIYDVTNSRLIEPSSKKLFSNSSTIADKFQASFQTSSDSVSYRLILHVASTSAVAYSLKIDSVAVSPSRYVFGPFKSDPVTFTPSISTGTHTITKAVKWRDGKHLHVEIVHDTTVAGSGLYSYTIPDGLVIDTSLVSLSSLTNGAGNQSVQTIVGTAHYRVGLNPLYGGTGAVVVASSTTVQVTFGGAASSTLATSGNTFLDRGVGLGSAMASVASSASSLKFMVPIVGWSSSQQQSDRGDGRNVALRAVKNSGSHTANGAWQDVSSWDSSPFDTHGAFNTSTGVYTCPVAGFYVAVGGVHLQTSTAANTLSSRIFLNGNEVGRGSLAQQGSLNTGGSSFSVGINCNAGDQIKIQAIQNESASELYNTTTSTSLSIFKLSGTSAISATETVAFSANTSTTVITANVTPIVMSNILNDTHSGYSAGTYTIRAAGFYAIHGQFYMNVAVYTAFIYINGTSALQGGNVGSTIQASEVYGLRYLNSGDTIQLRTDQNGTASNGAVINRLSIIRLGL